MNTRRMFLSRLTQALLIIALFYPAASVSAQNVTVMNELTDCFGMLGNGKLLMQRGSELYLVDKDSPFADVPPFGLHAGLSYSYATIKRIESDESAEHICICSPVPNGYSWLTYGDIDDPRIVITEHPDVILDARIDPQGRFVRFLRNKSVDFFNSTLEVVRISMSGDETVEWTYRTDEGQIAVASIGDSLIAFSTEVKTRTFTLSGEVRDSVDRYYDLLHFTQSGNLVALSTTQIKIYAPSLVEIRRFFLPPRNSYLNGYRILNDDIILQMSDYVASIGEDRLVFWDTIPRTMLWRSATPVGNGVIYLFLTDGTLISVHPDRTPELRYQLETRPGQPIFDDGVMYGNSVMCMASPESAIVAWYSSELNEWIVPKAWFSLVGGHIDIDVGQNSISLITKGDGADNTSFSNYTTKTDTIKSFSIPGRYTQHKLLRDDSIIILNRGPIENAELVSVDLAGHLLDSIALRSYFWRDHADSIVVFSDDRFSHVASVDKDGKLSVCSGPDIPLNGLSRVAEQNGSFIASHNGTSIRFSSDCTEEPPTNPSIADVTSVLLVGDSTYYVQTNKRVMNQNGRVILEVESFITEVITDSQHIYVSEKFNDGHYNIHVLLPETTTSVRPSIESIAVRTILMVWDGSNAFYSSPPSMILYNLFNVEGAIAGDWHPKYYSATEVLIPGTYYLMPNHAP